MAGNIPVRIPARGDCLDYHPGKIKLVFFNKEGGFLRRVPDQDHRGKGRDKIPLNRLIYPGDRFTQNLGQFRLSSRALLKFIIKDADIVRYPVIRDNLSVTVKNPAPYTLIRDNPDTISIA